MSDVVVRAKAALEGVTEGPWVVNQEGWSCISSGPDSVFHGYFNGSCGDCGDEIHDAASVAISVEDAEFIAAARTLVPELVAEVERLRAERPAAAVFCRDMEERAELFNEGFQEAMKQRTGGSERRAWFVQVCEQAVRNAWHAPVPVPANVVAGQIADALLAEVDLGEDNQ